MATFAVIFPAAGRSSRYAGKNKKPFEMLEGRAVWIRTVEAFLNRDDVGQLILVVAPEDREEVERKFRANLAFMGVQLVDGGEERCDSVANALAALKEDVDHVAVHDAVRPCVTKKLIDAVFAAATQHGAAVPVIPVSDTVKRVGDGGVVAETVSREGLVLSQTPQAFRRDVIVRAYEERPEGFVPTDDASLVERLGVPVYTVEGSSLNIKITRREDLDLARAILQVMPRPKPKRPLHPFADEEQMWR